MCMSHTTSFDFEHSTNVQTLRYSENLLGFWGKDMTCEDAYKQLTISWWLILLLIKNYNVLAWVQCIASKCQDTYYRDPYTFYCYFSGGSVGIQDVINMEVHIFIWVDWKLNVPTPFLFLTFLIEATKIEPKTSVSV